jgi:hypothetical protein
MFIVRLESVGEDASPSLHADMIEVIEDFFDERTNTMSMDYRLTTATVE